MYVDNWALRDPKHVLKAKYCIKQNILWDKNNKPYISNEFIEFYCKSLPTYNKMWQHNNLEAVANNAKIETKWAGLPYEVDDYIEFGGEIYTIESVKKDDMRMTPEAFHTMGYNPNTYYTLVLEKALAIKDGAISKLKGNLREVQFDDK